MKQMTNIMFYESSITYINNDDIMIIQNVRCDTPYNFII